MLLLPLPILLPPLLILTYLIPPTSPWAFAYRSTPENATSTHGTSPLHCTIINQTKGLQFEWDAQGGPWCIYLYKDTNCTVGGGWECNGRDWKKDSSDHIGSFEVTKRPAGYDDPALSTSTTAGTASPTATVTRVQTETQTVAPGGRKALDGGGIAGVVVGVLVAVAGIAGLAWFLGRRAGRAGRAGGGGMGMGTGTGTGDSDRGAEEIEKAVGVSPTETEHGQSQTQTQTQTETQTQSTSPELPESATTLATGTYRPPGSRMVELVGNNGTSELSDNNRVLELEGSNDIKRP